MSIIYAIFSYAWWLAVLAFKVAVWSAAAAIIVALLLSIIPVRFHLHAQNRRDDDDNVVFRAGWLFSAVTVFASANIAGYYEYGVALFGRPVFRRRELVYDDEEGL